MARPEAEVKAEIEGLGRYVSPRAAKALAEHLEPGEQIQGALCGRRGFSGTFSASEAWMLITQRRLLSIGIGDSGFFFPRPVARARSELRFADIVEVHFRFTNGGHGRFESKPGHTI